MQDLPVPPTDGSHVVLHTRVVTGTGGGPDKTILNSAPFLAASDYWLAAAYMHPPGDPGFDVIRRRAAEINSPLIGVPDAGPLDMSVFRDMLKLCKHYRVAIWHGHDYKSNLLGLLLRRFWKMKLVTTVHGWVRHTRRTPIYYAADRWSLPYYDHVICVSDDLLERMHRLRVRSDRCTLIRNAIDEQRFSRLDAPQAAAMRREHNVPPGRLVLGAVGRLSPEKGFDLLIKAAKHLLDEGLDFEVWIAGEGGEEANLNRLIHDLGVTDRVRLVGFCADMASFYEALDVFVLSSRREGLPNVVLEALAMRVPTVATRVAGVPNMLTSEEHALLCPCDDGPALEQAMRRLLTDETLRPRLADAGRALIEREYTFNHRMAKVRAIYDAVMEK